jgi:hypothetical protein
VIAPNNGTSRFDFGDTDSVTVGRITYNHNTDTFSFFTAEAARMAINNVGNVGIGTTSPDGRLNVTNASGSAKLTVTASDGTNDSFLNVETSNNEWSIGTRKADSNKLVVANSGDLASNQMMAITTAGNVGIGTMNPTAKLQVAGNVTVDGNIGAKYQDVAEWVDSAEPLEVATLVVIDSLATNRVTAAEHAYDYRVAGAVSAQPGVVLGEPGAGRVLIAQSGRVRVKADATHGAIHPGDILVSSQTRGHVMRSTPIKINGQLIHRPGTVVGKALQALPGGRGEILVLLTLQ